MNDAEKRVRAEGVLKRHPWRIGVMVSPTHRLYGSGYFGSCEGCGWSAVDGHGDDQDAARIDAVRHVLDRLILAGVIA